MKNVEPQTLSASDVRPGGHSGDAEDASTRQRVLQSVLHHGPSTAGELAERLELTPAAIRRHTGQLVEEGQLLTREQRIVGSRGRGRPSKVFALTDAGRSAFHQAYDDLAVTALKHLLEAVGESAIDDLARARVAKVEERYLALRAQDPAGDPVACLAEALSASGYVASTLPSRNGEQLCQHHCPIAHVATQFPQLCEAETKIFAELLGVHVQRLATIAHGDGVCTTHIPTITTRATKPRTTTEPQTATQQGKA